MPAPDSFFVRFGNFRGFDSTGNVDIRPITFLVGENSTGKTSFLAALRQVLEIFSRGQAISFNREPFFLGGFDQIAHYKGGRAGRAKAFSFTLSLPARLSDAHAGAAPRPGLSQTISHSFTFQKGVIEPELSSYVFTDRGTRATITLDGEAPKVAVASRPAAPFEADLKRLPPSSFFKRSAHYLGWIFDDLKSISKSNRNRTTTTAPDLAPRAIMFDELARSHHASSAALRLNVFASAPVRTEPQRTYTPSELRQSALGAHVPFELARQKSTQPERWKRIRAGLASFGSRAGLFDDIDIRQFGKRDGDPFQIVVRTRGARVNIADVGYGVSQALPIVYLLQSSSGYDVFLLQQPEVHLHPRAQAEIGTLISALSMDSGTSNYIIETHSDYMIDRVRIEVASKRLPPSKVTIVFFEKTNKGVKIHNLYLDDEGNIKNPPKSFRQFFLAEHARLLGL